TLLHFVPASTVNAMKSWQASRNAYLLSQIQTSFGITSSFPTTNGYSVTTSSTVALAGVSDVTRTRYVKVTVGSQAAGFATLNQVAGTWKISLPLQPGVNHILVQGLDLAGQEYARANLDLLYDNGAVTFYAAAGSPYTVSANLTVGNNSILII